MMAQHNVIPGRLLGFRTISLIILNAICMSSLVYDAGAQSCATALVEYKSASADQWKSGINGNVVRNRAKFYVKQTQEETIDIEDVDQNDPSIKFSYHKDWKQTIVLKKAVYNDPVPCVD